MEKVDVKVVDEDILFIPLKDLLGQSFKVNDYQRGYKWDAKEILELLNDVHEHDANNGKYCLQPIIFREFKDNYAKKHVVRIYESNYYILSSTRISGYYVELYTYDWYLNQQEKFCQEFPDFDLKYKQVKGQEDEPCVKFNIKGIESCLFRNFKNGKFELNNESSSIEFETIEEAIGHLKESYHAITN